MLLLKLTKSIRKAPLPDSIKCYSTAVPSPNPNKIELFVDDKKVLAEPGMTILQACALAGVEIPRYCYHERLSIAGNCRMCLVEVEKSVKPVASCAMPAMKGMKIKTNSPMARKAREGVIEFLLVNHPLDCPICDQAGECDLQDQTMAFGTDRSRFVDIAYSGKRAVEDKNIGPLVKTIMTRCIHCTRCIRFASEVAGVDDLGTTGRGSDMQVGTYVEKMLYSELSGNVIDLCPVGALTSKPYAFVARPWETRKTESIDTMDAVGSNIVVSTRGGDVLRILPKINDDINEEWISDKTRFAYDGLKYQRLVTPMFRPESQDTPFVKCEWEDVLLPLGRHFCQTPPDKMMAVVGNSVDTESMVALKEFYKRLGSSHVYVEDSYPTTFQKHRASYLLNIGISGIEESDLIIVIGCNPRLEAPIINARIRKTWLHNETDVAYLGEEVNLSYEYYHLGDTTKQLIELVQGKHPFTQRLNKARHPLVILGYTAIKDPKYGEDVMKAVLSFSQKLQEKVEEGWKVFNVLHTSANMVGALDVGLRSEDCVTAFNKISPSLVYLLGSDNNSQLIEAIAARRRQNSSPFLVVYQGHHGDRGASVADYILPGSAYTEKYGTFVNTEGRPQYSQGAATAPGRARVDWQILRALSEFAESFRVQTLAASIDPLVTRGQLDRSIKLLSTSSGIQSSRTLTLPYDDLMQARYLMSRQHPHLVQYGRLLSSKEAGYEALMTSVKSGDSGQVTAVQDRLMKAAYPLHPAMRTLKDFYQTDPISRASVTMAKCVQAAVEAERTKHFTQGEIKAIRA